MKISAYFDVHGIKVSEPKKKEELQLLQCKVSPETEKFIEWCEECDKRFKQHINDTLCIKYEK